MIQATGLRIAAAAVCAAGLGFARPSSAQSDETFEISHRPQADDHWRQKAKTETRIEMWQAKRGRDLELVYAKEEATEAGMNWRIDEVDAAGSHTRDMTISHLRAEHAVFTPATGRKVNVMDSREPDSPSLPPDARRNLTLMKDVKIGLTFDREGRVLSYRTEPEGNMYAEQYAAKAAKSIQQDFSIFPLGRLRIGETWPIGNRKLEGSFGGPLVAKIAYDLNGKLVGVESRGEARHALVVLYSSNPTFETKIEGELEGEFGSASVTMKGFDFNLSAEYDLAKGRVVKVSLKSVMVLSVKGAKEGETGELRVTTLARETDVDASAWMIDEQVVKTLTEPSSGAPEGFVQPSQ